MFEQSEFPQCPFHGGERVVPKTVLSGVPFFGSFLGKQKGTNKLQATN